MDESNKESTRQDSFRIEVLISRMLQKWSMRKLQRNPTSLWPNIPKSQSIATA